MLGLSMFAAASSTVFINGVAFLIPALHDDHGMGLDQAGVLAAMPTIGLMLTLIAWGAVVDRIGERRVLVAGTALTAVAAVGAALASGYLAVGACLLVGGMAAGSTNSASGRVVAGWFPAHRRGTAMGIRQMAQPLGVAVGAMAVPPIAGHFGIGTAFLLPAGVNVVAALACLVGVIDPPRPARSTETRDGALDNPYRQSNALWRIHAVSVLLVVPQFTVWTFALVWLMSDRHLSAPAAGVVVVVSQILGALGRMGAGIWSDRAGSRMRPLRTVAIAAAVAMALLALTDQLSSPASIALLVIASVITVADNGLAFTAVAEISGPYWSGRALGAQNTSQYLTASVVPPLFGAIIGTFGYPLAFLATALCPILAVPLVPVERRPRQPDAERAVPN
ncbi:MFS transporter [Rhodococcus sp. D2-41]|nr:MFS transporter [Rhodococcus sp. D2-41]